MVLKLSSHVLRKLVTPCLRCRAATFPFVSIAKRAIAPPEFLPAVAAVLPKSIISKIASMGRLRMAWADIDKSNRRSSGSDGVTIDSFEKNLETNLREISSQLRTGKYRFLTSKGVLLDKDDGGKRPLKISAIKDRVVCKSIALHVSPRLQKLDQDCSFAYRKKRSTTDAIRRVDTFFNSGSHWVLEADIQKFFDKVDRQILKKKLRRIIKSSEYINLIDSALTSEIHNPTNRDADYLSQFPAADSGIPQGNALSPLLANFYLHSFDKAMMKKNFGLVRFADDFVVMCKSKQEALTAFDFAAKFLKEQLGLTLHPLSAGGKSDVKRYRDGFEFLGFHVGGNTLKPSEKTLKRHKERIREIVREPLQTSPLTRKISRLNNVFKGWTEAFKGTDVWDAALESEAALADELSQVLYREKFLRRGDRLSHLQIKMLGILTIRERIKKRPSKSGNRGKIGGHDTYSPSENRGTGKSGDMIPIPHRTGRPRIMSLF